MVTTGRPLYRRDLGMVQTQIRPSYQLPDRTRCGLGRSIARHLQDAAPVENDQSASGGEKVAMSSRLQSNGPLDTRTVDALMPLVILHSFLSPYLPPIPEASAT